MTAFTKFFPVSASIVILCALPFPAFASGVYRQSNLGYDISFNALSYPATIFNFGIVGVTHGKAFTHNDRLASEYAWAHFGSFAPPTVYMNINAPYGSTVTGHTDAPKHCPQPVATTTGPTACQGYNYGYQAARDAFSYANEEHTISPFWWLDVETANSWSATTTVNDATLQGAIDYLNMQGVQVGVYSMPFMWTRIAGSGFAPTQIINGVSVAIPTWLPIGVKTQVSATNACLTEQSFIPKSPIWLIQYEASSTAIDQNYAC